MVSQHRHPMLSCLSLHAPISLSLPVKTVSSRCHQTLPKPARSTGCLWSVTSSITSRDILISHHHYLDVSWIMSIDCTLHMLSHESWPLSVPLTCCLMSHWVMTIDCPLSLLLNECRSRFIILPHSVFVDELLTSCQAKLDEFAIANELLSLQTQELSKQVFLHAAAFVICARSNKHNYQDN